MDVMLIKKQLKLQPFEETKDIRQLRYIISVAENLNFTEAAGKLFVYQSAVSQQITNLEEH